MPTKRSAVHESGGTQHLVKTTLPAGNGHVENGAYDRAGRLIGVENVKGTSTLSRFSYTLDPVGNPLAVGGTSTTTYKYDLLDRLTEACFAAACTAPTDLFIRYTYDPVGNRVTEARSGGTTSYTYNAADQLVSTSGANGTVSYTYDTNGNQTAAGSRTFKYDVANRLVSTTSGRSTTAYSYDGDGRRLQASSGSNASSKTNYLWDVNDPLPQLLLERDGGGALIRRYLHGAGVISVTNSSGTFYYHRDTLGSVVNVTSASGVPQWSYEYEPFGALRSETKMTSKAPANLLRFTGQLFDTTTGWYHLRARDYDSQAGRFSSLDPLPARKRDPYLTSYGYAADRPTVFVDPTGLAASSATQDDEDGALARDDVDENTCGSLRCFFSDPASIRHIGQSAAALAGGCLVGAIAGETYINSPVGWVTATVAGPEAVMLFPAAGCLVGVGIAATGYAGPAPFTPHR